MSEARWTVVFTVGCKQSIVIELPVNAFTLYNVCAVPWGLLSTVGVFSTVGDIMINVGDILSTVGVFSTVGDIMSTVGGILSTVGGVQYRGDIMMHVGGYHEYRREIPSFEI